MPTRLDLGLGLLLETIGLDATNALMAYLRADAKFVNVVPLIEAGTLNLHSPLVGQVLPVLCAALVKADAMTQKQADALLALAESANAAPVAVGGYTIGQLVRLLPPWDGIYPGTHTVEGFGTDCLLLSCGASMAVSNVEAV